MSRSLKISFVVLLLGALFSLSSVQSASAQTLQQLHELQPFTHLAPADETVCDAQNDNTCNGANPDFTMDQNAVPCEANAYPVDNITVTVSDGMGFVQLMYSPNCKTNYAQLTVNKNTNGSVLANANITRSDGLHYDNTQYVSSDGVTVAILTSPMVYSPVLTANACASVNNLPGGCTGYH